MATLSDLDEATPEALAEAISHMLHAAKREIPVHRKSELHDDPTPWDVRHADLDDLCLAYERAVARVPA